MEEVVRKFTSSYHEYMAGYWAHQKRLKLPKMTLETVISSMPLNILEAPDESAYHKLQADLDEKVDALHIKIVKFILITEIERTRWKV